MLEKINDERKRSEKSKNLKKIVLINLCSLQTTRKTLNLNKLKVKLKKND